MTKTNPQSSLSVTFKKYYRNIGPILKKPTMQASTTAVFSFLSISLFLWYAVRPTAQTIIYLQREIADKTTLNQQMEAKITALIEAQATYENIKDRLPILDDALPHQPDAVILAREIRNIANLSQASVSAVQIPAVPLTTNQASPGANLKAQAPLQTFPVTIVLSGSYPSLKSFLDRILQLRRITSIDQISLKQIGTLGLPGDTLQLSIRIQSYYSLQ